MIDSQSEANEYQMVPANPEHHGADQIYAVQPDVDADFLGYMLRREDYGGVLGAITLQESISVPAYAQQFIDFSTETGIYVPTVLEKRDQAGNMVQLVDAVRGLSLERAVAEGIISLDACDETLQVLPTYLAHTFEAGKQYPADVFALDQYMYGVPVLTHEQLYDSGARIAMVDVTPLIETVDPTSDVDARFAVGNVLHLVNMVITLEERAHTAPQSATDNDHGGTMRRMRSSIDASLHYFESTFPHNARLQQLTQLARQNLASGQSVNQKRADQLMY